MQTLKKIGSILLGAGLSFTLLHNNVPICSGGIIPLWNGEMLKVGLSQAKEF